ncbi:MAG TPA: hypothetical protein VH518_09880 [Tepidisphaeraceae bacterium]|jgi:hypothetical protein
MVKAGKKTFERDGRTLHGMGFMVSIRQGDVVETEFQTMAGALHEWYVAQGDGCGELTIGFIGNPQQLQSLLSLLTSLIKDERPLRPLFKQLGVVDVTLITPDGKSRNDMKLRITPQQK